MNTKLKELESQCWESRPYGPPWFNSSKFAELIIRHSIWIAYHSHAMSKDAEFTQHLDAVKEHFGIKD